MKNEEKKYDAKTEEITFTNSKFIISGYMNLEDVKTIKEVKVYWEWPYQTGSAAADLIDTEDAGKNVKMQISVTGTQVLEVPAREISFTIDGNKYKAKEGMVWREWVDSPEYDSTGFISDYGETYNIVYTENYEYYVKSNTANVPVNLDEGIIEGLNYELRRVDWPL